MHVKNARQKKKPLARKPLPPTDAGIRKRRNAWEPQVIVPQQVDLPLELDRRDKVAVPAAVNGRSLADGRL